MDPISLLDAIPAIAPYLAYVLAFGGMCAIVATQMPPPKPGATGAYPGVYALVNWCGANLGHARNANAPAPAPASGPLVVSKTLPAWVLLGLLAPLAALSACSPTQVTKVDAVEQKAIVAGQLYCARATANGPLVVAVATAAGAPVIATGATAAFVASVCAGINAIPVAPPADPAAAPVVTAPIPAA